MNLKQYEAYKNSGIIWLDKIPKEWQLDRTKNIGVVKARVGWKALKASEYVSSGYFFLSTPNISKKVIDFENVNFINKYRYYESPEIMLKDEDVLLVKDGSTLGIVNYIEKLENEGTVNSSIAILRFKKQRNKFYYYFLKSKYIQNVIGSKKEGMGVPHLFQKDINNFILCVPPRKEQTQIISFLDAKTEVIDKKVALLQKKIKCYQELKISLVNEAVTLGLNNSAKFKHSGIEWIGKIPENWETDRGKDLFIEKSIKNNPNLPLLAASQKLGVVLKSKLPTKSMEATKSFENFKLVSIDDFVISLRSFEGGIEIAYDKGIISPAYTVFSKRVNRVSNRYFKHLFKSDIFITYIQSRITGIRDGQSIKYKEFQNIFFALPPKNEQQRIAIYLDEKTQKIDAIIKNIQQQIGGLKEYRKTLINDVVTGKIKVTEE